MTPISYATHLNEAVVADNKLASCSFPSRQAFPFPHQVIAYGNGLDVRSTRQVQPWHLGPASFAGTPTARIGLGRASASADNTPTGNKASPPHRERRVGQNEPGAACAPGLPIPCTRGYQLARASPRTHANCGSRDQRCVAAPSAASHKRGRLLTPSAHRANELQTRQKSASTTNATRLSTRLASHKRGRLLMPSAHRAQS